MRFTIYKKLILGFFIVILVLIGTIALNFKQLNSVNGTYQDLLEEQTKFNGYTRVQKIN